MKSFIVLPFLFCVVYSAPKLKVHPEQTRPQLLTLPSNATSIRVDITDAFSCAGREYGYYADVDNDCQIFHICLPVTYPEGREQTFRWSFICPEETMFNQEMLTCASADDSIDCAESPKYYDVNLRFGSTEENEVIAHHDVLEHEPDRVTAHYLPGEIEEETAVPEDIPQVLTRRMGKF